MRFHVCLACFLFCAGALFAQSDRGVITGAVLDQAGAVVPNANVVARNTETGAQYETQTTATGNYTLSQLPAGSYDLSVEAAGFNKFVQQGIRVFVARTERVDVTLRVGGTTESITVSADASLLKTENEEQSTTIGVEKLDELPLNFGANGNNASANIRNPYTFVTLVPTGTISSYSTIRLNGAPINTFQVRVEGQQANNNRLMIRQDQLQPSVEALQEVSVQASNFSAEYGQVAGGMFNLTAKSGTNQFHGSLFEYFVNEDLGAGIPFTNSGHGHLLRPPNRRNDFGGSFGGPVWIPKLYDGHNRTFFFFAIEEFYQRQVTAGVRQTVPTLAMRTGDFSGALTGKVLGTDPAGRQILENAIYDPNSDHTVNGQIVRDPFPNNTIPMSRLDPVALKIQSLIPAPVRSGTLNNWDQSYAQVTTERIPSIKIDQFFPNQGKLSFFYSRYVGPHYNGSDGLPVPITMVRLINTLSYTIRLNYDQPVTPTFLVHAGVGFVRHPNPDYSIPEVLNYDPIAGLGLKGALFGKGFPGISGLSSPTGGGMGLNMGANGAPIWLNKPTAVLSASLVRSNHTYKAGGEWRIDAHTQPGRSADPKALLVAVRSGQLEDHPQAHPRLRPALGLSGIRRRNSSPRQRVLAHHPEPSRGRPARSDYLRGKRARDMQLHFHETLSVCDRAADRDCLPVPAQDRLACGLGGHLRRDEPRPVKRSIYFGRRRLEYAELFQSRLRRSCSDPQ